MPALKWFERRFEFGLPATMLPFYLERLAGTPPRLQYKVRGFDEARLSFQPDGKWSVKQTIGHLADVDEIALRRIDEMVTGVPEMAPAVFEPKQDYNAMKISQVLTHFGECRTKNLARYASLTTEELVCSSLHPRLKLRMTPVDLAWFDAEHDDHHLAGIGELLGRVLS